MSGEKGEHPCFVGLAGWDYEEDIFLYYDDFEDGVISKEHLKENCYDWVHIFNFCPDCGDRVSFLKEENEANKPT